MYTSQSVVVHVCINLFLTIGLKFHVLYIEGSFSADDFLHNEANTVDIALRCSRKGLTL